MVVQELQIQLHDVSCIYRMMMIYYYLLFIIYLLFIYLFIIIYYLFIIIYYLFIIIYYLFIIIYRMMWAAGSLASVSMITYPSMSALVSCNAEADQQGL